MVFNYRNKELTRMGHVRDEKKSKESFDIDKIENERILERGIVPFNYEGSLGQSLNMSEVKSFNKSVMLLKR